MNQLYKTILLAAFISIGLSGLCLGQDTVTVQDSIQLDSMKVSKENPQLSNISDHNFSKLINTNFDGFSDVMRNNASIQVFDFMDLGQPRFVAPINMFPHQAANFVDDLERNEYTNGMFNTRFLSLDQTEFLTTGNNDRYNHAGLSKPEALIAKLRRVDEDDAYTRLKFYEGDYNYTDLDILFAREFTENIRIGLAGFNKGYSGNSDLSGINLNNAHTGVAYNAFLIYQINKTTQSEFTFRLNHERSGVHKRGQESNFTYSGNGSTYNLRFIFDVDTVSDNKAVIGFLVNNSRHKNRSGIDSFRVKQHSEDYSIYLSKDFSSVRNKLSATFKVENHVIWGNAFSNGFSDTRFLIDIADKFKLNEKAWLNSGINVEQLNNFKPNVNVFISPKFLYSDFLSRLNIMYSRRYPNPVERSFLYGACKGNSHLNEETFIDFSLIQRWQPTSNLFFETSVGYNQIRNEIIFTDNSFKNGKDRSWSYLAGQGAYSFWKIKLSAGGHLLSADQTVSSKQMFWGQVAYHDYWFNTVLIDATANMNWYSRHDAVYYNPVVNRFYSGPDENASYMLFNLKLVGTVSDAEVFLEIDNPLKTEVQFIEGYYNELRKIRFGVNWVLWD